MSNNKNSMNWYQRLRNRLRRCPCNQQELTELLLASKHNQIIDKDALEMIEGVLQVSQMQARDIMIPKAKIVAIDNSMSAAIALPIIIDSGHSRYPVIEASTDKIQGVMLAKDLLKYVLQDNNPKIKIQDIIRPIIVIPESKRLDALLKEFRQKHNHMAIILDEYGNIAGLITIEDILEQIVGDIEDEYDEAQEPNIKPLNDNKYLVKATTPIEDFNLFFNCNLNDENADTMGGFLLREFSHLPKQGEVIRVSSFEIKVIEATRRGIQLLRVMKSKES